jgi:thiamine-monophosphate kinase
LVKTKEYYIIMNEFSLIERYFKSTSVIREDVVFGIGDDAACLRVSQNMDLLVSTDTLVENIHFLPAWDAYDIAWRSAMVNISDIAAMGGTPCWAMLALTMPICDESWLSRFAAGLHDALNTYQITLIGGDTTRGPLTITLTLHGLVPQGRAVRRSGAAIGDKIIVTGELGAAALAVSLLKDKSIFCTPEFDAHLRAVLMEKLLHPKPRVDWTSVLQTYASAAIDISDGLTADLNHILEASGVGACLLMDAIPVHPLVQQHQHEYAMELALGGGDDYELCFTVSPESWRILQLSGLKGFCIGVIEAEPGLRARLSNDEVVPLEVQGYSHFI